MARPGWADLEAQVQAGAVDVVVVWKMDRAFRRLKEAVDFLDMCQQRGVAFVSVTEGIDTTTPFGPVLFALFSAMAQLESRTRSDRTDRTDRTVLSTSTRRPRLRPLASVIPWIINSC